MHPQAKPCGIHDMFVFIFTYFLLIEDDYIIKINISHQNQSYKFIEIIHNNFYEKLQSPSKL